MDIYQALDLNGNSINMANDIYGKLPADGLGSEIMKMVECYGEQKYREACTDCLFALRELLKPQKRNFKNIFKSKNKELESILNNFHKKIESFVNYSR